MDRIEVWGGVPLSGEVTVQGSKNAALPLMAAAVLHQGKTVLSNCPHILDVEYMSLVLKELGCEVVREGKTLMIDAEHVNTDLVSARFATRLRASVLLMGSLLGRFGRARLPYPGGCTIGQRPIDLHLEAFERMGVEVKKEPDGICLQAAGGLRGCRVTFPFPSVGATENAILGAVLAKSETVLEGCAREPEIVELCRFLNAGGADIRGVGGSTLTITGVEALHDLEYELMADRIVAGTYLLAVAGTRGQAMLYGAQAGALGALTEVLEGCGARISGMERGVFIDASAADGPVGRIVTEPYPGFPTDLQSQMMVYLCTLPEGGEIEETVFESRFLIARELQKMGARLRIDGTRACVRGAASLRGCGVNARELRGGAALVSAALAARGRSVVSGGRFIRRGYEDICRDLAGLGADIREI